MRSASNDNDLKKVSCAFDIRFCTDSAFFSRISSAVYVSLSAGSSKMTIAVTIASGSIALEPSKRVLNGLNVLSVLLWMASLRSARLASPFLSSFFDSSAKEAGRTLSTITKASMIASMVLAFFIHVSSLSILVHKRTIHALILYYQYTPLSRNIIQFSSRKRIAESTRYRSKKQAKTRNHAIIYFVSQYKRNAK